MARHLKLIRRVILWIRTVGTLLLGCWMSSVCSMLRMVAVGNRQGRLLYLAAVSALAPELFDQPLRRSFRAWSQLRLCWSEVVFSPSGYRSMSAVTALFGHAAGTALLVARS